MDEIKIEIQIKQLKGRLTGNLLIDSEIHQEIYELKKILNPKIVEQPELDDDECLSCGS